MEDATTVERRAIFREIVLRQGNKVAEEKVAEMKAAMRAEMRAEMKATETRVARPSATTVTRWVILRGTALVHETLYR